MCSPFTRFTCGTGDCTYPVPRPLLSRRCAACATVAGLLASRTQFAAPHLALRRSPSALVRGLGCFRRVASRATLIMLVITGVTLAQRTYLVCIRSIRTSPRHSTAPSRLLCRCCFIDGFALNRFPPPLRSLFSSVPGSVHTPS
jgi:hypothetical protein